MLGIILQLMLCVLSVLTRLRTVLHRYGLFARRCIILLFCVLVVYTMLSILLKATRVSLQMT